MRYGVLNPVSDGVQMAVMEDEKLLFSSFAPMKSREAAGLPLFAEKELNDHGLKISDVSFWTTGAGPGGFTSLRMTAALIAAWALEHDELKFRCVPAAFGIAGSLPGNEGDLADCLFDGRNHEVLLFGLVFRDGEWKSRDFNAVLNADSFKAYAQQSTGIFVVDAKEYDAVTAITGTENIVKRESCCADLIRTTAYPYDNDPDKLVYIREAVELRP